jgi:hypothetical protein
MSWTELWSNGRSLRIRYKGLDERDAGIDSADDIEIEERHTPVWLPVIVILLALPNFTPLRV